jgi:Acetyltransferase (GNAT) domain
VTGSRPDDRGGRSLIVRVHSRAPRDQWRAVLAEDPLALPEHTPEWVDAVCAGGPFADATRLYEFPDGRRFVLPLVRQTGLGGVVGQLWSLPRSWGLGGLVGRHLDTGVIRAVVDDLAALPAVRVVVRPDPLRDGWEVVADHPKVYASPRRAHVLDLTGGLDAARAGLSSLTRRNLRTAEKHGVRVEVDRDGSLLPIYHRFYDMSLDRWAGKQNEPLKLARWRGRRRDPVGKFDVIAEHMGDAFRHYVAFVGDTPAASIIVLFGRTASYSRGAMDRDVAGPVRANDLLQWTAIQDACAAGCTHYHMHETGESESLARFKERFGAASVTYSDYRIERLPVTKADKTLRTAVKKVIGFRDTDNASDEAVARR